MKITHVRNDVRVDRECGSLDVYHVFEVVGSRGDLYTVRIRVAGDDPQEGNCTCPGYKYRGTCKHLTAAYAEVFDSITQEF